MTDADWLAWANLTEADWLACTDPCPMLHCLKDKASDRKLRLIACAYCRSLWAFMGTASQRAILLREMMADEPVNESHRRAVVRAAIDAVCRFDKACGDFYMAADMAYQVPCENGSYASARTIGSWSPPLASAVPIVRDIIGNPYRPKFIEPNWLTRKVINLSSIIYEERAFDALLILADALEEAGCHDADILAHCRGPGPHVKGCWVIDLLLGKQ